MSQPRQGVLPWTIPSQPELPPASQQRCRELLSHMLLAATTHDPANATANQLGVNPTILSPGAICDGIFGR